MASSHDLAFGRLAQSRGLVDPQALREVYAQLPPGQSLGAALVERGLLSSAQAHAIQAELRRAGSGAVPVAQDGTATLRPTGRPAPAAGEDGTATLAPHGPAPIPGDGVATWQPGMPAPRPAPAAAGGLASSLASGTTALPQVGEWVHGRYHIQAVLGKGGMGAVYRARDAQRQVQVALKLMLPGADPEGSALARFQREAEAVAKVDAHAGIVRVRDLGYHQGAMPFAVHDLVEGRDLHAIVKSDGALPVDEALRLTEEVARALEHCHVQGILHRDLKPANVMLRASDQQPFVMDFGLAFVESAERLTQTGEVMGTPAYMSPEQAEGDPDLDARTDVYALGAILYELLAARPPFTGEPVQILKKVFLDEPEPLLGLRPELPPDAAVICAKAMAKEREQRYPSALALAEDLARLRRGEPIAARAPTRLERFRWRLRQRDPSALAGVAALLVVPFLLVALGFFLRQRTLEANARRTLHETLAVGLAAQLRASDPLDSQGARSLAREAARTLAAHDPAQGVPFQEWLETATNSGEDARRLRVYLQGVLARWEQGADDPLARLLAEGLEDPRPLRRLTARLILPSREPLPPDRSEDPATRLLAAARLLRWGQAPGDTEDAPLDLATARAELNALAEAEGTPPGAAAARALAQLDALEQELRDYLEEGVAWFPREARRVLGKQLPGSGSRAWRDPAQLRVARPLRAALAARLRAAKPPAAAAALKALRGALRELPPARWQAPATYQALAGWQDRQLTAFLAASPAAESTPSLRAEATALLELAVEHASSRVFGQDLEAVLDLLEALGNQADWSSPALRKRCNKLLTFGLQQAWGGGKRPSVRALLLFPRIGTLPRTQVYERLLQSYLDDGSFPDAVRAHPHGNTYLLWAHVRDALVSRPPLETVRELVGLYAAALGDDLSPAQRERLGLDPAVPLEDPLPEEMRAYTRLLLARHVCRWRRRAYEAASPSERPATIPPMRVAAAFQLEELTNEPQGYMPVSEYLRLLTRAGSETDQLAGLHFESDPRVAAELRAQVWQLYERALAGSRAELRAALRPGSAREDEVESYATVERCLERLVAVAKLRAEFHQVGNDPEAAIASLRATQALLAAEQQPPSLVLGAKLVWFLAEARRWEAVVGETQALLAEYARDPRGHGPDHAQDRAEAADELRLLRCMACLQRDELEGAWAAYDAARAAGGARSEHWGPTAAALQRRGRPR